MFDFMKNIINIFLSPSEIKEELDRLKKEVKYFKEHHDFSFYKPSVGVFGVNSSGKSTFLNSLLGNKDEFEMGLSETTSEITCLCLKDEKFDIKNVNFRERDYEQLKYFHLFDIPGFGKYFSENILKEILPVMDIVFWLIDISKGIVKEDKEFLKIIKDTDVKVIVIANKIDLVVDEGNYLEVEKEIEKYYRFFIDNGLSNNLIGIIPLSAKKALIGKLKKKNEDYVLLVEYVENLLTYAVFIESFKGMMDRIYWFLNSDDFIKDLEEFLPNYELIANLSVELQKELSNKISFLDSIFGDKADEARPIVNRYSKKLEKYLLECSKNMENYLKEIIQNINNLMYVYNNLVQNKDISLNSNFDFYIPKPYISLYSISGNCFFGDSFAFEVSEAFLEKSFDSTEKFIQSLIDSINKEIDILRAKMEDEYVEFQKYLGKALEEKLAVQKYLTKKVFGEN